MCRAGHGGGTAGAGGPAWAEQGKDGHQHGRSWPGGARGTGPEGGGAALQGPSAVLLHTGSQHGMCARHQETRLRLGHRQVNTTRARSEVS